MAIFTPASRRKALIIGINYNRLPEAETMSGQEDADKFMAFLMDCRGWKREDIVLMKDNTDVPNNLWPTKVNLYRELRRLVKDAEAGDQFILYYAGHSTQMNDGDEYEEDGMDEAIITADAPRINFSSNSTQDSRYLIIDNELKKLIVDPLPTGSQLIAIFDTCHSGTLLDLDHYKCNTINGSLENMSIARSSKICLSGSGLGSTILEVPSISDDELSSSPLTLPSSYRCESPEPLPNESLRTRPSPTPRCSGRCSFLISVDRPHVVSLSACADTEVTWGNQCGGIMTMGLLQVLGGNPGCSYRELLTNLICWIKGAEEYCRENWDSMQNRKRRLRPRTMTGNTIRQVNKTLSGDKPPVFPRPQLSSHARLYMDETFPL